MPILNNTNCSVDPKTGGITFTGSPELQAIQKLSKDVQTLNVKLDVIIKVLQGVVKNGGTLETTRFSTNNDPKI